MKSNKVLKIIITLGLVILMVISLLLIFNRQVKNQLIRSYQPTVSRSSVIKNERLLDKNKHTSSKSNAGTTKQASTKKSPKMPKGVSFNFSKVKSLDVQTAVGARMNASQVRNVGQIMIPQSGLHLPIGLGVSNTTLALAAGTMRPNQKMGEGNYPLAGHHMVNHDILFGPLYYRTKVGQSIYLTDMKYIYRYVAYQKKFISAYHVSVINQTKKPILTLITCDKIGKNRLMVRGKYQAKVLLKDAPTRLKRAFEHPQYN